MTLIFISLGLRVVRGLNMAIEQARAIAQAMETIAKPQPKINYKPMG